MSAVSVLLYYYSIVLYYYYNYCTTTKQHLLHYLTYLSGREAADGGLAAALQNILRPGWTACIPHTVQALMVVVVVPVWGSRSNDK